nr:NADH-quinone oxidoreductase subunit M [Candidatus Freyarchaeota archaeon]
MLNNILASYELLASIAVLLIMGPIVYLIGKKSGRTARWLAFIAAGTSAALMIHIGIVLLNPYAISQTLKLTLDPTTWIWTYSFEYTTQGFPWALTFNVQLYPFTTSINISYQPFNFFDKAVSQPLYLVYKIIPNSPYLMMLPISQFGNPLANISLSAGLIADGLSYPIAMLVSGLGAAVMFYCAFYMKDVENPGSFFGNMLLFIGGMLGVLLATNVIEFFLFWEVMLIPSYILVNQFGLTERKSITALKYFLWTTFGSVIMFAGLLMMGVTLNSFDFRQMSFNLQYAYFNPTNSVLSFLNFINPSFPTFNIWVILYLTGLILVIPAILIFIGFAVKMAIFPLHTWLPDTYMEAPMPVVLLLSAAMTKTAAYGIARFLVVYMGPSVQMLTTSLGIVALVTAIYGGILALTQKNLKRMLAYSSMSQMGYILFGFAMINVIGVNGSLLHVLNHGICMGVWFMVAGIILKTTGTLDFDKLGGLSEKMPTTAAIATIAGLSVAGVPPLLGFTSEWMIFAGGSTATQYLLTALLLVATAVTLGYYLWAVRRIFFGPLKEGLKKVQVPRSLVAPIAVLAAFVVVLGIVPAIATQYFTPITNQILPTLYGYQQILYLLGLGGL